MKIERERERERGGIGYDDECFSSKGRFLLEDKNKHLISIIIINNIKERKGRKEREATCGRFGPRALMQTDGVFVLVVAVL